MNMTWEFGVLEPWVMALGKKEDEGTHTHKMVIGHLETYYTLGVDVMMHTPLNFNYVVKYIQHTHTFMCWPKWIVEKYGAYMLTIEMVRQSGKL